MVQANRIKTVAIVGPTAIGKSEVALRLAREFDGELVGADSMQIYRGFDIGTGKLTREECGGIKHWLIDVADGDADFSVGNYTELASKAVSDISSRNKLPIIVGGTGMYVYSLLSGCNFADTPKNDAVRANIKLLAHIIGGRNLHKLLEKVDGISANTINENDVKRVSRALEIFSLSGKPKSDIAAHSETPYDELIIVLTLPRELLYKRINARVKKMFDDGLIQETNKLMKYKDCGAMQALGYKQIARHLGEARDSIEEEVAQKTRNYAKRQMTYFNNMKLNKIFIDARDFSQIKNTVKQFTENVCTN